ncbi:hypothetical protein MAPG_04020 [Magnaporthiopsis poae ATCC 64411]|uniref:Uncharacterized protein n=1 Tax=Magnaporthiopsis poae (strain ATCC 64411 / 73-15) TaxID=644358 RepID=A0A0C4DVL3_MAGP6|nr:hypothetical protein MAPG_04020 [Magnaporthiopsis poae ATCC 64411]
MDSASNKTIPGSEGPDSPSNASEFSTANVVGMFLTLSLCLLTQPYGSLFYRPYGSAFGRLVFFFWRLNPLACACEAVIIAGSLFHFVASTWNGANRLMLSWRFPLPFFRGGLNLSGWRRALHIHAAVLLLLRANDHGEKLATLGSPSFVDNLLAHGYTRLRSTNETPGTNDAPPPIHTAVGGASVAPGSFDTTATPATTSTHARVGAEGFDGGDVTNSQYSLELLVRPGLLHRRTTRAGEGRPASQPDPAPPEVQLERMRDALGRNVLAGQEKWVDLVAIVCMLVVTVKLAATTLPWPIRLAAAFMLADWYLVQLLLYLFHLDDLRGSHMQPIVNAARREQSAFRGAWVGVVTHLVALPVIFYLAYVLYVSGDIFTTRYSLGTAGTAPNYLLLAPILTVDLALDTFMVLVIMYLPLVPFWR